MRAAPWVLGGLVLVAGCPSSSLRPAPVDDFDMVIDALCERAITSSGVGHFGGGFADLCTYDRDPTVLRLRAALEDGRMGFDRAAYEACIAADRPLVVEDVFADGTACVEAFVPLTEIGGACDSSFECIDGFCARTDYARSRPQYVAGGCGVCTPLRTVDEPCEGHGWVGSFLECERDLYCGPDDRCHAYAAESEPCADTLCGEGLACDAGRCVTPRPLDLVCASDGACESGLCVLHCAGDGAPCSAWTGCSDGTACLGHCGTLAEEGEACDEATRCRIYGACVDGVCRAAREGESCDAVGCADGTTCIYGTTPARCRAEHPVGLGEVCVAGGICAAGQRCVERCLLVRRVGESCDDVYDVCVDGADCRDGRCEVGSLVGGPCVEACAEGFCQGGTCVTPRAGTACMLGLPTCGERVCTIEGSTCVDPEPSCVDVACHTGEFCSDVTSACTPFCIVGR